MNKVAIGLLVLSGLAVFAVALTQSMSLQAVALIPVGLLALVHVWGVRSGNRPQLPVSLLGLVIVAAIYFIVRASLSPVRDLGVEDLMLILPAFAVYLVCTTGQFSSKVRWSFVYLILGVLILHLASALIQLTGGRGFSLALFLSSSNPADNSFIVGMYGYRGSFANYTLVAGFVSLSLGVWHRCHIALKSCYVSLALLSFLFVVLSGSRSAVLSMVFGFIAFVVLSWLGVKRLAPSLQGKIKTVIGSISALGLLIAVAATYWVFQSRAIEEDGIAVIFDSGVRLAYWPMALEQWYDHPLVGAGSRSYSYECFRYWSPNLSTSEENPEFVHNEYLQALADYGIIGLVFVLMIMGSHFYAGLRKALILSSPDTGEARGWESSRDMVMNVAGITGAVVMFTHNIFDFRLHLLPNLVLLVVCMAWIVSFVPKQAKGRRLFPQWFMMAVVFLIGGLTVGLGVYQLWGGWPLIENRLAKEDGFWDAQKVNRTKWDSALEESVRRVPTFRRYQKLAALSYLQVAQETEKGESKYFDRAVSHYRAAIARHPHDLVSAISLANLYVSRGDYQTANDLFKSASDLASSRERWFKMHSLWADMHLRWAVDLMTGGKLPEAEKHYVRSLELYLQSRDFAELHRNHEWQVKYTKALLMYTRFLADQSRYDEADQVIAKCMELSDWSHNGKVTGLFMEQGLLAHKKARYYWYKRQPEKAAALTKRAIHFYKHHIKVTEEKDNEQCRKLLKDVNEMDDFFTKTGVKPS